MRSSEAHANRYEAIKKLHDLYNGPLHCFGHHSECSTDYCKLSQQIQNNKHDIDSIFNNI